jgi:hypothetical protein
MASEDNQAFVMDIYSYQGVEKCARSNGDRSCSEAGFLEYSLKEGFLMDSSTSWRSLSVALL